MLELRKEYTNYILPNLEMLLPEVARVRAFAIEEHGNQMYGDKPYSYHLDQVASIVWGYLRQERQLAWFEDRTYKPSFEAITKEANELLKLAYVHDVLEDCAIGAEYRLDPNNHRNPLESKGVMREVCDAAALLMDRPGVNRKARKRKTWAYIRSDKRVVIVKVADRLANGLNGGKLDMYQKEFPLFEAALYDERDVLLQPLWDELYAVTFPEELALPKAVA